MLEIWIKPCISGDTRVVLQASILPKNNFHKISSHPSCTKKSLPYSLAIRAKHTCSDSADLTQYWNKFSLAFQERGYPSTLIDTQISIAISSDDIPFITKYHPGLQRINTILKNGYNFLTSSTQTQNLFGSPPRISFKQPSNLHNLLVHPKLPDPNKMFTSINTEKGSHPCIEQRCNTCKIHSPSKTFNRKNTKKQYPIQDHYDCHTSNFNEFLKQQLERGKLLRSRHLQYLLSFSYWPPVVAREGPNIYEIRSYRLKPGTMIEWGNNWARAINYRRNNDEPFAAFFSQIGRLYNVHHIWCYKDLQARKETRESAWRSPGWDECVAYTVPLIREMHSRVLHPTSFSPTQ
uniref:Protein NipSnap n=1 Tax=Timema monikensis TaxID=170555 RepID=A0A7R9EAX2_9NEOP|nr:unnamed protein product [Timema monikensis]